MALNDYPLVSIITPVYNGAEYLDELIHSVLDQDYPRIEHVIIDDGSQDGGATVAVLEKYPHLRWWSRENRGQYATMNEGLRAAQGEYVCFVSADDVLAEGAISTVMQLAKEKPGHDGFFGTAAFIDASGHPVEQIVPFKKASIHWYQYFAHISHCSLYLNRLTLLEHDLFFDSSLKYAGDYEWLIRVGKSGLKIGFIDQDLSKIRIHTSQATKRFYERSLKERKEVRQTHEVRPIFLTPLLFLRVWARRLWKASEIFQVSGLRGLLKLLADWLRNGEHKIMGNY